MRDGILENATDARWLATARRDAGQPWGSGRCEADIAGLTEVALYYALENTRRPIQTDLDMRVDDDGYLVMYLNDDANPPGWYYYCRRADLPTARAEVLKRHGVIVTVPLAAMLSEMPVRE